MFDVSDAESVQDLLNVLLLVEPVVARRSLFHAYSDKTRNWPPTVVSDLEPGLHLLKNAVVEGAIIERAGKIINMDQDLQPAVAVAKSEQALISLSLNSPHFF